VDYPAYIQLPFLRENPVSPHDSDEDKYPESMPRYFMTHFTREKDKVFDPFMGHGTTAFVAEELGRIPYGIEADPERHEWTAGQCAHWQNIRCGDAGDAKRMDFPKMDFCITSPPFMAKNHGWNPLYCGDQIYAGYDRYLLRMAEIFAGLKSVMKKGAHIVVHADNVRGKMVYTPLVRDLSIVIAESFKPVGETIIKWEHAPEDYPLSHALIFKNS